MRQIGCLLLEAPTASGKTVMLAAAADRTSAEQPVVWFWDAPFKGVVQQTAAALRRAAPGLRVRDPRLDRMVTGTRPGDVFVSTWAAVAARNAESRRMRADDDLQPALESPVRAVRDGGLLIGAVVDEAHHSFRPNSEAFRFLQSVLQPDLLILASATPNDADVELLRLGVRAGYPAIPPGAAISRDPVVAARLNKQAVKAVTFIARGANQGLLDLNEVALRKAVEQHRALKQALHSAGIPMVPLLLVQAATSAWNSGPREGAVARTSGASRRDPSACTPPTNPTLTCRHWRRTHMLKCWYSRWRWRPGSMRRGRARYVRCARSRIRDSACR